MSTTPPKPESGVAIVRRLPVPPLANTAVRDENVHDRPVTVSIVIHAQRPVEALDELEREYAKARRLLVALGAAWIEA